MPRVDGGCIVCQLFLHHWRFFSFRIRYLWFSCTKDHMPEGGDPSSAALQMFHTQLFPFLHAMEWHCHHTVHLMVALDACSVFCISSHTGKHVAAIFLSSSSSEMNLLTWACISLKLFCCRLKDGMFSKQTRHFLDTASPVFPNKEH